MSKKRKQNSGNPAKKDEEKSSIWVRTEPTLDGKSYAVTIEFTDDHAFAIDADEVPTYVQTILTACAQADYDAAVLKQMSKITDESNAAQVVIDLRRDRPEPTPFKGWTFTAGVAARTREGFLTVAHEGEPMFQMDPDPARQHALHVLESLVAGDLDQAYLATLRGIIGLEEHVARNLVSDLATHR